MCSHRLGPGYVTRVPNSHVKQMFLVLIFICFLNLGRKFHAAVEIAKIYIPYIANPTPPNSHYLLQWRPRGGIEPLHVPISLDLKFSPNPSWNHGGLLVHYVDKRYNLQFVVVLWCLAESSSCLGQACCSHGMWDKWLAGAGTMLLMPCCGTVYFSLQKQVESRPLAGETIARCDEHSRVVKSNAMTCADVCVTFLHGAFWKSILWFWLQEWRWGRPGKGYEDASGIRDQGSGEDQLPMQVLPRTQ